MNWRTAVRGIIKRIDEFIDRAAEYYEYDGGFEFERDRN